MPLPIVIAYHLIWTGYGWWFPNDLRGSTSHFIASDALAQINELHFGSDYSPPEINSSISFPKRSPI